MVRQVNKWEDSAGRLHDSRESAVYAEELDQLTSDIEQGGLIGSAPDEFDSKCAAEFLLKKYTISARLR